MKARCCLLGNQPRLEMGKGGIHRALNSVVALVYLCSVFDGKPIPYPKREFLTDEETEDKSDTSKVSPLQACSSSCSIFAAARCRSMSMAKPKQRKLFATIFLFSPYAF